MLFVNVIGTREKNHIYVYLLLQIVIDDATQFLPPKLINQVFQELEDTTSRDQRYLWLIEKHYGQPNGI